jgi:hypothetical protein
MVEREHRTPVSFFKVHVLCALRGREPWHAMITMAACIVVAHGVA